MDDLIAWLRVQLDEDERVARAVDPREWLDGDAWAELDGAVRAHAAAWDPHRVLAEVEAKRRVLELTDFSAQFPDTDGGYDSACEDVIKLLALPYADRPGYLPEWRPSPS